jgi:putative resolvase
MLRIGKSAEQLGVCAGTLRRWADTGQIEHIVTAGGQRRFNVASFRAVERKSYAGNPNSAKNLCSSKPEHTQADEKKGAIYCRVSSGKQKDDLERQIQALQDKFPNHKVFKDICSGLKYKRKGLTRLLDLVQKGDIREVVVAHKDRLARFGVELIQWIIERAGASLVILDQTADAPEQELTQDLMAIVHVFSCRLNGRRRYVRANQGRQKEKVRGVQGIKQDGKEGGGGPTGQGSDGSRPLSHAVSIDPVLPNAGASELSPHVVPGREEDVQSSNELDPRARATQGHSS